MLARLGETVKRIRGRRGWSTSELAQRAGCDVGMIERLEAGQPGLTTTHLDSLAHALEVEVGGLRRGEEVARPAPSVFLLHQGRRDFRDADSVVLDGAIEHARVLNELATLVGVPAMVWPDRRTDASHHAADAPAKQGYQLANDLRKVLDLPSQRIDDLVNVLEERFGIVVLVRDLPSRGACAVVAGDARAIVLDASTYAGSVIRARTALAHETCHVLHDPTEAGVHIVLDAENDRSTHANEQRARAHAAEMLLPRAGLNGLFGLPSHVTDETQATDMVHRAMVHFGATWQLTANHLSNRGFVDRQMRVWLEAANVHSPPTRWPMQLPTVGGPSLAVSRLTQRAHREALITDGEARAMLGIEAIDPLPWDGER